VASIFISVNFYYSGHMLEVIIKMGIWLFLTVNLFFGFWGFI
jgi:hypothetical protein